MKVLGSIALFCITWFIMGCIASFCVMVGISNIHDWWSFVPTIGFWDAFSITVWFAIPLGIYSGYTSWER
jgi:hypothetical protein